MTEKDLQNRILRILYFRYRDGKSGQLNFSEIKDQIPELDRLSRVEEACRVLKANGYIEAYFILGNSGYVKKITAQGREFVEENLLNPEELISLGLQDTDKIVSTATVSDEDGDKLTTEAGDDVVLNFDNVESDDTLRNMSVSYKTTNISNKIKDNNVSPCFGIETIADVFLSQLDRICEKQAENVCMLGIFGEWGRGKTYFFNYLSKKIGQRKDTNTVQYDIVRFNAWKYQDTPAIWAYLFETVYHKASVCTKAWYLFRRNIWSFLYQLILFSLPTIILALIKSLDLITVTSTTPFWTVGAVSTASFVLKLINDNKDIALSLIKKFQSRPYFSHHLGVQSEIEKELEKLLKSWICKCDTSKHKVLLYVDDIDRCPASKMSDIVESLRVVLENEEIRQRMIVICSIDSAKLKADISNKIKSIFDDADKLAEYVSEQLDKLFIFGIGLCRLSNTQLGQYLDELAKDDKVNKRVSEGNENTSDDDSPIDTSRIVGSVVATRNSDEPREVTTEEYVKILKNELTRYEGITPRKARIIYYRILFANNIMSARNGALITDSLVKKIIDLSMSHNNATDIKSAYSDLIEMVVPY